MEEDVKQVEEQSPTTEPSGRTYKRRERSRISTGRTAEERNEARQRRLLARAKKEEGTPPPHSSKEEEEEEEPALDIDQLVDTQTQSTSPAQNGTPPSHNNTAESVVVWQDAIAYGVEEQREQEQKMYFTVIDGWPVTLPNTDGQPFSPRFVEQEGLFVGQKPNQSRYLLNRNRLEQRLLRESTENIKWFSQDGHIDNQPSPLKALYERPSRWFDPTATYIQTQYIEPATTMVDVSAVPEKMFQLELDILYLKFYDHPLFSKEDILASQLELLFMEYQERQMVNLTHFYSEKLQALELHLAEMKKNPQLFQQQKDDISVKFKPASKKISTMLDPSIEVASKLSKLRETIRQTRILRDIEEHNDIMIVRRMIAVWNQLKDLREQQGFSSTAAVLLVKKTPTDLQADMESLEHQMGSELREMKDDHDTMFAEQLDQYRKQIRGKTNQDTHDNPAMPQYIPFDDQAARTALLERYKQTKRKPGSPLLTPVFSKRSATEVTPTSSCDPQEQTRRLNIERTQIYLKLLVNNKFVTKTKVKHPNLDFQVEFGELFTLQLVKWPDNIKLQVVSATPATTFSVVSKETILAELLLRLPVKDLSSGTPQNFRFESPVPFVPVWYAVGTEEQDTDKAQHFVTGMIKAQVGWAQDEQGKPLQPPLPPGVKTSLLEEQAPVFNVSSTVKLREWLTSQVDPNDPRNLSIQHLMKKTSTTNVSQPLFCISKPDAELLLPESQAISRHKLLQMRNNRLIPRQQIPLVQNEISSSLFETPESPLPVSRGAIKLTSYKEETLPAAKAQESNAFIKEVRAAQVKQVLDLQAKPSLQLSDILKPVVVAELNILEILKSLTRPRRKLRPERKERPPVTLVQATKDTHCEVLVQIVRGFNIPPRKHAHLEQKLTQDQEDTVEVQMHLKQLNRLQILPFVEVSFQSKQERTHTSYGSGPQWHETISFPFQPPGNDFSNANLQVISDSVHINLFDELTVDLPHDNRNVDELHQRKERRWIGGFSVPFNAIYTNKEISGTFRIQKPLVSLSHTMDTSRSISDLGVAATNVTMLSVYVTLNPPLQQSDPPKIEEIATHEDSDLIKYGKDWVSSIRDLKKGTKRRVQYLAIDLTGRSVLITRYIRSQNPPAELNLREQSVLRFVSLIPFLEDSVTFVGKSSIWNTSKVSILSYAGWRLGRARHFIVQLLFMYPLCEVMHELTNVDLKKEAWVVLGSGAEGEIAYVLVQENGKFTLYNPVAGDQYDTSDPLCPVKEIGCVFNDSNVSSRVTQGLRPHRYGPTFNNMGNLLGFFNPKFLMKNIFTLQTESLEYLATEADFIKLLEADIEESLLENIRQWRKRFPPRWNSKILKSLLEKCEPDRMGLAKASDEEHERELLKLRISYNVHGFPLNMPYTDVQHIIDTVFQTNIHKTEDPKAEFAIAAQVVPYPNRILSVWIYIAILVPK